MSRAWSATISNSGGPAFRIEWQILEEPGPTLVDEGSTHYHSLDEALNSIADMDTRERKRTEVARAREIKEGAK